MFNGAVRRPKGSDSWKLPTFWLIALSKLLLIPPSYFTTSDVFTPRPNRPCPFGQKKICLTVKKLESLVWAPFVWALVASKHLAPHFWNLNMPLFTILFIKLYKLVPTDKWLAGVEQFSLECSFQFICIYLCLNLHSKPVLSLSNPEICLEKNNKINDHCIWLHVNIPKVRYSDMGNKAE